MHVDSKRQTDPGTDSQQTGEVGFRLRAPRTDDIPLYTEYLADPVVSVWLEDRCQRPMSALDVESFVFQRGWVVWSIESGQRFVGITGLSDPDAMRGLARFFIVIGDRTVWGKGLGTRVTRAVLDKAFTELGLRKVVSDYLEPNEASRLIHKRNGFTVEGRLRQDAWRQGRWVDRILLSILREEYQQCSE
jgi:RimJ/RimL family protein N-acetyltransferase